MLNGLNSSMKPMYLYIIYEDFLIQTMSLKIKKFDFDKENNIW